MQNKIIDELESKLSDHLADGAYMVTTGRELVMELREIDTDLVWMSTESVTRDYFENLGLEEGLVKVGAESASMDCAGFNYSPGRKGEPVLQRVIDGRTYINVARPMKAIFPEEPTGPARVQVDKSHVLGFRAGRSVAILKIPDGYYVEVVGNDRRDDALVLPQGGELMHIALSEHWLIELPSPTSAFFWFGQGMRSFQGPVQLPRDGQRRDANCVN